MDRGSLGKNRSECAEILEKLLARPEFRFDRDLKPQLPTKRGLYVIFRRNGDQIEYLHAGRSGTGAAGLGGRVWEQHFHGGGKGAGSDLVQKVIDNKEVATRADAQAWIEANCFVKWDDAIEDKALPWAEHYMLSLLRPTWGR